MKRELWAKESAERLWHEHGRGILKRWESPWHLEVWLRDECRCVYCGRDLLQDRGVTYFLYTYDHVLPKTRYPDLQDTIWNNVLACKACNSFKYTFDPCSGDFGTTRTEPIPAAEEYRERLIERAKAYVRAQKAEPEASFEEERRIITGAMQEYESGKAASG